LVNIIFFTCDDKQICPLYWSLFIHSFSLPQTGAPSLTYPTFPVMTYFLLSYGTKSIPEPKHFNSEDGGNMLLRSISIRTKSTWYHIPEEHNNRENLRTYKITLIIARYVLSKVRFTPDSNPEAKSKITSRPAVVRLLCDGTNSCEGGAKKKQTSRVSDAVTIHSNAETSYQHRTVYRTYILVHSSHMRELSSAHVTSHSDLDLPVSRSFACNP
jgi:hypothetical protein